MKPPIASAFDNAAARQARKGQILIYEGDPPANIYYLEKGYVKVYNILSSGAERVIFIYQPGDMFPLTSYLSRAAAARYFYECLTEVEVLVLRDDQLAEAARNNLNLGEALIGYTLAMNRLFMQRIDDLSASSAQDKVVHLLNFIANRLSPTDKGRLTLDIPLRVQNIANMCGLTRETATVQLQHLRGLSVIHGRKQITIDLAKLKRLQ